VNQQETLTTIASFFKNTGYLLDPHTAVGVKAALDRVSDKTPVICLATAHPAKFGDAVITATGRPPDRQTGRHWSAVTFKLKTPTSLKSGIS
jgi:threonine synthase